MDTNKMREQFEDAYLAYCGKTGAKPRTALHMLSEVYVDNSVELAWEMWKQSQAVALAQDGGALTQKTKVLECRLQVSDDTLQCIRACLRSAEADIDQLKAGNEALRQDAERYQYLRQGMGSAIVVRPDNSVLCDCERYDVLLEGEVDRAVDADMAEVAP